MSARRLLLLCCLLAATSVSARDWLVRPDGSGDAPTIQAAIDSLGADDHIVLADGVYTGLGNRDLYNSEKAFTVRSLSDDPTACVIDVQGTAAEPHWAFSYDAGG